MEKCFVFDDDVFQLRDNQSGAAVTHQTIEKHLKNDHIHFSFRIKKNTEEPWSQAEGHAKVEEKKFVLANKKLTPHFVPNKGSMRANNGKKGQSIPDVKLIGIGILKKETVTVDVEEAKSGKSQPPDYSSINRFNKNQPMSSPAYYIDALKRNDNLLVSKLL